MWGSSSFLHISYEVLETTEKRTASLSANRP